MTIIVGCKVSVKHQDTYRTAEILQIRATDNASLEYYVHFINFNKRLDTWVGHELLDMDTLEQPETKAGEKQDHHAGVSKKESKKNKKRKRVSSPIVPAEKEEEKEGTDEEPEGFSKEREIEKLRVGGSMTQSIAEIARVKNIKRISVGRYECDTWYFSPYPEEYTKLDVLYICEFCLEPVGKKIQLQRHQTKCTLRHPPGNEIYRKGEHSFFEIDGRKQRRYCRNLCLLSKLFLDHKTLYYDVDPFMFYLFTQSDSFGHHLLGYFSKGSCILIPEKQSSEDYNVACILTLPYYQRMGYGKMLISFSYELTKIEKKTGSPEKPLSDLDILIDILYNSPGEITIQELSDSTAFTTDDIMNTLQALEMIKFYKSNFIICLSDEHIAMYEKSQKKKRVTIDPACIKWEPPRFAPSQLRF